MSNYHILCVEDEEMSRELLVEFLSELDDVDISTANDGEAGLRLMETRRPDLILLDIKMPVISGFDLCKIIKSSPETATIPIIFLSGYSTKREIAEAKASLSLCR